MEESLVQKGKTAAPKRIIIVAKSQTRPICERRKTRSSKTAALGGEEKLRKNGRYFKHFPDEHINKTLSERREKGEMTISAAQEESSFLNKREESAVGTQRRKKGESPFKISALRLRKVLGRWGKKGGGISHFRPKGRKKGMRAGIFRIDHRHRERHRRERREGRKKGEKRGGLILFSPAKQEGGKKGRPLRAWAAAEGGEEGKART